MTNTQKFAIHELNILETTVPGAIVTPFRNEILALCEAFGKSGQSGGSAPMTATAISQAVKSLLLQEPICNITNHYSEWNKLDYDDEISYQNNRCYTVFKKADGKAYYLEAIIWKGEEKHDTFIGSVYIDDINFELIRSRQYVKFPFKPKSFYIDVIRVPISKQEAEFKNLHYIEDGYGECYYTVLKDPKQLNVVFKYYDKYEIK